MQVNRCNSQAGRPELHLGIGMLPCICTLSLTSSHSAAAHRARGHTVGSGHAWVVCDGLDHALQAVREVANGDR